MQAFVRAAAIDPSAQKRRINDLMREGLRLYDPAGLIPFFCECSMNDCYRAVWRTSREYDDARRDDGRQLLADHLVDDVDLAESAS